MPKPKEVRALLAAGLRSQKLPLTESRITRCLADHLDATGHAVWGSKALPATTFGVVNPDLAWAKPPGQAAAVVLQVKTGGRHQEDQEVYEFLNDVLYAAYDLATQPGPAVAGRQRYCVVVLHLGHRNRRYWPLLSRMRGRCVLELAPSEATAQLRPDPGHWLLPSEQPCVPHRLQPFTRTQLSQIFSGTQKATYVNLFRRPGRLFIHADAQVHRVGSGQAAIKVLTWRIVGARLLGAEIDLAHWMP